VSFKSGTPEMLPGTVPTIFRILFFGGKTEKITEKFRIPLFCTSSAVSEV